MSWTKKTAGQIPAGDGGGGDGSNFGSATVARVIANANLSQYFAEPTREYFTIVNESITDLFVSLDLLVDPTAGAEHATIVLPGGVSAGFDLHGYTGPISFQYADASDATNGYALFTRGYRP